MPLHASSVQEDFVPSLLPPDINASAPIEDIIQTFFKHDFVVIRNMLPPLRMQHFCDQYIRPIYKEDDKKIAEGYVAIDDQELRQLKTGWIADDRLRRSTKGALCLEDAILSRLYVRLADTIMGTTNWRKQGATNTRRMPADPAHQGGFGSITSWHVDYLWQPDKNFTLTFWVPLTECGKYSPGLEFILSNAEELKKHSLYNPSIPEKPLGPLNTNPRLAMGQFEDTVIDKAFGPEIRWVPELNPGDLVLFSGWAPHRTHFPATSQNERISLEYRIIIDTPDSPIRAQYSRQFL